MAKFNLDDYETVEQRIKRFYELHPNGRIITELVDRDTETRVWVVKAFIYLNDEIERLPTSTGYAFEIDGSGMANQTSALENCETSAIGRALANMGLSGNKRASREEMEKVARGQTPRAIPRIDIDDALKNLKTKAEFRALWVNANKAGASKDVLTQIEEASNALSE
jgi:hypothetical protein